MRLSLKSTTNYEYEKIRIVLHVMFWLFFLCNLAMPYCIHNGKAYSSGQTWQAKSSGTCRKCKCVRGIEVKCIKPCADATRFPLNALGSLSVSSSSKKSQSNNNCDLDGQLHQDGQSWTETGLHAKGLDSNQCMECNCKVQVITCAIRSCPLLTCKNAVSQTGSCCKVCPDRSARPPRTSVSQGCTSIDRRFNDKEQWQLYLPSRNVFATCVDCSCQNGREHCRKHSCPQTKCDKPTKQPGDCCALCPGERSSFRRPGKQRQGVAISSDSDIFGLFLRRSEKSATKSNGKSNKPNDHRSSAAKRSSKIATAMPTMKKVCRFGSDTNSLYHHNQVFNPILNSNIQKCTKCICMNSVVKCARIRCPVKYPCAKPELKEGFCCKVCPGMNDREAKNLEVIQMHQNRGCARAKKAHVQVYRYNDVTASAMELSEKYLFDKSRQDGARRSELHLLKLKQMTVNVTSRFLSSDEIMRSSLDRNWHYLGAIKERMFARFIRQERDLKKCKESVRCIQKMTHLIEQLKTKAARRRRCRSSSTHRPLKILQ